MCPQAIWSFFIVLARYMRELGDEVLRELVYTLHIVQLQERLLYRRDYDSDPTWYVEHLCGSRVTSETPIGEIFFDVREVEKRFHFDFNEIDL
jgi:hypothetical protein